jgi:predicted DNA-binding protein
MRKDGRLQIRIEKRLLAKVRRLSGHTGQTVTQFVESAIREKIERLEANIILEAEQI